MENSEIKMMPVKSAGKNGLTGAIYRKMCVMTLIISLWSMEYDGGKMKIWRL